MYQTHWGLDRPPFPSGSDPRLFYKGVSQREALARLRFVVENRRRLGLLLSETGLGKSQLLKAFAAQCLLGNCGRLENCAVAQVDLLGISSREFYWQLGTELHAAVQVDDQPMRLFQKTTDQIQENRLQDIPTVLLLDNVDQAGADLLTQLLRLVHLGSSDNWLSIVLTTNQAAVSRLGEQVLDMVDLRIDLQSWDELDTTGYLQFALFEAGAERPLFDELAVTEIHHLTDGNPRKINRLADCALQIGSGADLQTIDSATVHAASESIGENRFARQ